MMMSLISLQKLAFKLFYKLFFYFAYDSIYGNYLKNKEDRKDQATFILNDSFLVFEKKKIDYNNYEYKEQFQSLFQSDKGLITTIIYREAIKYNIKNKRHHENDASEEAAENMQSASCDPVVKLLFAQVKKIIEDNFKHEVVNIFYANAAGYTTKEIAEDLKMNENTVKTHIRRIKEFVRNNM